MFKSDIAELIYDNSLVAMDNISANFNKDTYDQTLIDFLDQKFFQPNLDEFNSLFDKNSILLNDYPYIFNKNFKNPSDNSFSLFPVDDNFYYEFNKFASKINKIEVNSSKETKYFFENLDNPLFVENEFNVFNLNFLVDNVRASEDVAYENHIYLYYDDIRHFSSLLSYCDFQPLLKDNKVVFLFGLEERALYPIDFNAKFGIDYDSMEFQEVRVEEINRIIVQTHIRNGSGNGVVCEITDWHPSVISMHFAEIGFGMYNKGVSVKQYIEIINNAINNNELDKLKDIFRGYRLFTPTSTFKENDFVEYFKIFEEICIKYDVTSLKDWLSASYLANSRFFNQNLNSRISPIIHHTLHWVDIDETRRGYHFDTVYNQCLPIFDSFKYFYSYAPMRDPMTTATAYIKQQTRKFIKNAYDFGFFNWILYDFNFNNNEFSSYRHKFENKMLVRFEDLKMNPKATLISMCKFFNINYDKNLEICSRFGVDQYTKDNKSNSITHYFDENNADKIVDGYAVFSVYDENLNYETYTEFDIKRLEMAFFPVYEIFGYKPNEYDYTEYTDQEIMRIFEKPFKFEQQIIDLFPKDTKFNVKINEDLKTLDILQYNNFCRHKLALNVLNYRKKVKHQMDNDLINIHQVLVPDERFLVNPIYTNVNSLPHLDDTNVSFLVD